MAWLKGKSRGSPRPGGSQIGNVGCDFVFMARTSSSFKQRPTQRVLSPPGLILYLMLLRRHRPLVDEEGFAKLQLVQGISHIICLNPPYGAPHTTCKIRIPPTPQIRGTRRCCRQWTVLTSLFEGCIFLSENVRPDIAFRPSRAARILQPADKRARIGIRCCGRCLATPCESGTVFVQSHFLCLSPLCVPPSTGSLSCDSSPHSQPRACRV